MSVTTNELVAIATLVACEETTGRIYDVYAERCPALAAFWVELAKEEQAHAAWVRLLLANMECGTVHFQEGRFTPETYAAFLTYLEQRLTEAHRQTVTPFAALTVALDIEGTFVEKNLLEVFAGDAAEIRNTLRALTVSSVAHMRRVKEMWEQHRPSREITVG